MRTLWGASLLIILLAAAQAGALPVLSEVFYGSGECAEVIWSFLGLSMPGWTFIWYTVFTAGTIIILSRAGKSKV